MKCVEWCKNWVQLSMFHGMHCFNCIKRKGYPFRGQPDKRCENYAPMTKEEKEKLDEQKRREAVEVLARIMPTSIAKEHK